MKRKVFELKEEHLKLLSNVWVGWDDMEYGAPAIDPKRPYGNSYVQGDIAEILGVEPEDEDGLSDKQLDELRKIHLETQTALQIILSTRSFEIGIYECEPYTQNWKKL